MKANEGQIKGRKAKIVKFYDFSASVRLFGVYQLENNIDFGSKAIKADKRLTEGQKFILS